MHDNMVQELEEKNVKYNFVIFSLLFVFNSNKIPEKTNLFE